MFLRNRAAPALLQYWSLIWPVDVTAVGLFNQAGGLLHSPLLPVAYLDTVQRTPFQSRNPVQLQQHELAREDPEMLAAKGWLQRAGVEGQQLRLDAANPRGLLHGLNDMGQQLPLRTAAVRARNKQVADQAFVIFVDEECVPDRAALLQRRVAGQGAGVHKAPDQVGRATVVPVQLLTPQEAFFFQQRFQVTRPHLPQIQDLHPGTPPAC